MMLNAVLMKVQNNGHTQVTNKYIKGVNAGIPIN